MLECWDRKRKDYVAVKIIRNIQVGVRVREGRGGWFGRVSQGSVVWFPV